MAQPTAAADAADTIDLRSDTITRPTAGMREAIAAAEVGDDTLGDDPTVKRLEQRIADILDKEAALFFPSGIMANQTALLVLGAPGTEVVCEATSHILDWEMGGAAVHAGLQVRPVAAPGGVMTPDLVAAAVRPPSKFAMQTSVISLENTHNGAGGRILPLDAMRAIREIASDRDVRVHLDGARLWNAAAATGVPEAEYAACADTVMVTLSKGLGCPVGSMLAGTSALIQQAHSARRRLGGSLRQAGILAAAGLYALDHHRERLHEDHHRARTLARLAAHVPGIRVVEPETNIVMLDVVHPTVTAAQLLGRLAEHGVLLTQFTPTRLRAVTHLDVGDVAISRAAEVLAAALAPQHA